MGLRQEKFSKQLQKDLGDIFLLHKDWVAGQFVTISGVTVSPDLSSAKVYLSLFNTSQKAKVLEAIELNAREIRMEIAKKVKNQVKKVPELHFYKDESQEYAAKIDQLLDSIKKS